MLLGYDTHWTTTLSWNQCYSLQKSDYSAVLGQFVEACSHHKYTGCDSRTSKYVIYQKGGFRDFHSEMFGIYIENLALVGKTENKGLAQKK